MPSTDLDAVRQERIATIAAMRNERMAATAAKDCTTEPHEAAVRQTIRAAFELEVEIGL
jgi:hypothetical protein